MKSNRLLMDSRPLVIIPELAQIIGLNESIVIQQIHYWIQINEKAKKNLKDGFFWTYNSMESWVLQFPFWSMSTLKRVFKNLENEGLLVSDNYSESALDRTKWYRVDYEILQKKTKTTPQLLVAKPVNLEDFSIDRNEQFQQRLTQAEHESMKQELKEVGLKG